MFDEFSDRIREKTLTRRSFLRGSGLLAAAVGIGVATSRSLLAQEDAGRKDEKGPTPPTDPTASRETKRDSHGDLYRTCPGCRGKMYNYPANVWTCENCGYAYSE